MIFKSGDNVSVTKGLDGVIEVKLGKVSEELLDTKIANIRFDPTQQYNPRDVISALERTAEMKRAMAASINTQIQQSYQRSQDLQAYARNPMGWHGPPPQ